MRYAMVPRFESNQNEFVQMSLERYFTGKSFFVPEKLKYKFEEFIFLIEIIISKHFD